MSSIGVGEVGDLLRLVGEGDHEELVLRVGGLEEFDDRLPCALDLARHAAAHVEDDAEGDGSVFAGEGLDLLLFPALKKTEVVAIKPGDEPVHGVGDGNGYQHQIHIHFHGLGVGAQRGVALGRRILGSGRLNARLNVNVFGGILSVRGKVIEDSDDQQNREKRPSRERFAALHRPC